MNTVVSEGLLNNILDEAKALVNRLNAEGKQASWSDYEYFKHKLHSHELFGYESQIANILSL